MTANRHKTALILGTCIVALVATTTAWAQPQQASATYEYQQRAAQEEQRVALEKQRVEEQRAAQGAVWEYRTSPALRIGNLWRRGAGSLGSRALANAEEIELTEVQQDTIRSAQRDGRRDEIRREADIKIAELELEEIMEADDVDLDAAEAIMRQVANLQVDERMAGLRVDRSVRSILTAAQADQLDEVSSEGMIFRTLQRSRNR